jgi:hypothetical protein
MMSDRPFCSPDLADRPFAATADRDFSVPAAALYQAWTSAWPLVLNHLDEQLKRRSIGER